MLESTKLLIIDLDGTLVDTKHDIAKALNRTFAEFSKPAIPMDVIAEHVGSGVTPLIQKHIEAADVPEFNRKFEQQYLRHIADESRMFPGWAELLPRLSDRKLFVLTNKIQKFTDALLTTLDIKKYFIASYGREAFTERKPSPFPVLSILRKENVAPENALMIGDMPADLESGRAAGAKTCAVLFGYGKRKELLELNPTVSIENAGELAKLLGISE